MTEETQKTPYLMTLLWDAVSLSTLSVNDATRGGTYLDTINPLEKLGVISGVLDSIKTECGSGEHYTAPLNLLSIGSMTHENTPEFGGKKKEGKALEAAWQESLTIEGDVARKKHLEEAMQPYRGQGIGDNELIKNAIKLVRNGHRVAIVTDDKELTARANRGGFKAISTQGYIRDVANSLIRKELGIEETRTKYIDRALYTIDMEKSYWHAHYDISGSQAFTDLRYLKDMLELGQSGTTVYLNKF